MPVNLLYIEGFLAFLKESEQISVQKSDLGKTGRAELGISGQQDLRLPTIWCSFSGFQDAEKSPQHLPIKP